MRLLHCFSIIILVLFIANCRSKKHTIILQDQKQLIINNDFNKFETKNTFLISGGEIIGDTLKINLKVNNKAKDNEFDIYWDGSIMKSLPPKLQLFVVYKTNTNYHGKPDKDVIIKFDLSPIKEKLNANEKAIINISGFEKSLEYKWEKGKK